MQTTARIGNAHGFWGDSLQAAEEMLAAEPDLDFLTLDFLAEVSMSILAAQRARDPNTGYARDIVEVITSLAPYWRAGGKCRLITNAGGLNPQACASACQRVLAERGCAGLRVAVVSGDDVVDMLRSDASSSKDTELSRHLDTHAPIAPVMERLTTAHAYLGASPIVEALSMDADIVITGRVADPSLTVAACIHTFGWQSDDWHRLAGATVAGHVIECGAQATGGISTDWLTMPEAGQPAFPIAEVADDGSCTVTKPRGSGGRVSVDTVKEQLLYEIGDPRRYLSPDVTVSFLSLKVEQVSDNCVAIRGAQGAPPPETLKVSATLRQGFRAAGQLTVFGDHALAKAKRAAAIVLRRLAERGVTFGETSVEYLGAGACARRDDLNSSAVEIALRIAVADDSREAVEQFCRAIMPLITAGPPGTTGYAAGRPAIHAHVGFWPCLIRCERVLPSVKLLEQAAPKLLEQAAPTTGNACPSGEPLATQPADVGISSTHGECESDSPVPNDTLASIALARSGDKGHNANIGVIARREEDFGRLRSELTVERVARHLSIGDLERVERFELPNLAALNFVIHGILDNSLRTDAQGKSLAQWLLQMPINQAGD